MRQSPPPSGFPKQTQPGEQEATLLPSAVTNRPEALMIAQVQTNHSILKSTHACYTCLPSLPRFSSSAGRPEEGRPLAGRAFTGRRCSSPGAPCRPQSSKPCGGCAPGSSGPPGSGRPRRRPARRSGPSQRAPPGPPLGRRERLQKQKGEEQQSQRVAARGSRRTHARGLRARTSPGLSLGGSGEQTPPAWEIIEQSTVPRSRLLRKGGAALCAQWLFVFSLFEQKESLFTLYFHLSGATRAGVPSHQMGTRM